jgi:hypothetical protein
MATSARSTNSDSSTPVFSHSSIGMPRWEAVAAIDERLETVDGTILVEIRRTERPYQKLLPK